MTSEQLATYRSAVPNMSAADARTLDKGNEMLAQAGMPPLTPEQAKAFLAKQHARRLPGWVPVAFGLSVLLASLDKNKTRQKNTLLGFGLLSAGYGGYLLAKRT